MFRQESCHASKVESTSAGVRRRQAEPVGRVQAAGRAQVDSHLPSLPPKMIVENPVALGVGKQWFPLDPLVGQMDVCIPALGILARLQHCVGGKAQLKESGAQTRDEQRLGAILDLGTHVRVHHRESQSTARRRAGPRKGGNRDVFDAEDNRWQSCKRAQREGGPSLGRANREHPQD